MRVLLCERDTAGHRAVYMKHLMNVPGVEFYVYAPERLGCGESCYIPYEGAASPKSLSGYLNWIRSIRTIVKQYDIQVVHFPDGDAIRRFFGLGFSVLGAQKVVLTYHHFFPGRISALSYRAMAGGRWRVAVGHTDSVCTALRNVGLSKVCKVEYPAFDMEEIQNLSASECKAFWGVPEDAPVIGIVGGLASYKRILPFLHTLAKCKSAFRVLICGSKSDMDLSQLQEAIAGYAESVTLNIRRLTDEEYRRAIAASDIIYSIYGLDFDGASGPLIDGVCANKLILSSNHGSLGQVVRENHLGVTCSCMEEEDVLRAAEEALSMARGFSYDQAAQSYRQHLNPERFLQEYGKIYSGRQ